MSDLFAGAATAGGVGLHEAKDVQGSGWIPLLSMIGTLDEAIMAALGTTEELLIEGPAFTAYPQIGPRLSELLETLAMEPVFREIPAPPTHNLLIWDTPSLPGARELRVVILKGVGHVFPNDRNNPHGFRAADFIWDWMGGLSR